MTEASDFLAGAITQHETDCGQRTVTINGVATPCVPTGASKGLQIQVGAKVATVKQSLTVQLVNITGTITAGKTVFYIGKSYRVLSIDQHSGSGVIVLNIGDVNS